MKKNKKIIIQEEISVTQEWVDKQISKYKGMNPDYFLGFGDFNGGPKDIIGEIRKMSNAGRRILLMSYEFENSEFYNDFLRQNKNKENGGKTKYDKS